MRAFWSTHFGPRIGLCVLAPVVLALLLLASPAQAADVVLDGIVAMVNGKIITRYDYDERVRPVYEQVRGRTLSPQELQQVESLRRQILDQMIDDLLILQDAERYKLKVSDAEVEEQIKVFREKRQLSEEEFKKQLVLQRLNREDFARNMKRDLIKHRLIGGVVSNKVVVTDTEVEQQYLERKAEFSKDSTVQLGLVLLPAGMKASELKTAIEAGQITFAQAADKYTQGPGGGHGGDIGYIAWKDLAPEWSEALRGLKPGQITQPVHIQEFEGLLQVVSLKEGEELPLESVREQIYQSLHEGKFEKVFQDYLKKQRDKAVIEYRNL
ncbi:MAG: SurA N-terminal domain-containing protein [Humidesulfovibrio sp.]|nr:SurA N-terminal domain-containing protein [Humidesulfovibrio sp.]